MAIAAQKPLGAPREKPRLGALANGDQLSASEFMRRYEAMPDVKKAELIDGIVYMGSPVSLLHAKPDGLIQLWLGNYSISTPGTQSLPNATVRLDADNVPQPDSLLRLLPECGGKTQVDAKNYLIGPPELIVEIAASSTSIDMHRKLRTYKRAGVQEYLVWRTLDQEFDWFVLQEDEYRALEPDGEGNLQSAHFPGLVLNLNALLAMNGVAVLETLQAAMKKPVHLEFVSKLAASLKS
jgi:Uma2 family endonuclease